MVLKVTTDDRGHPLHKVDGKWGRRVRGANAARRSVIILRECPGIPRVIARNHESHRMWVIGTDLYFCMQGGCHARRQVEDLAARCLRIARSGKAGALKHLRKGIEPTSKKWVGPPFPVHELSRFCG